MLSLFQVLPKGWSLLGQSLYNALSVILFVLVTGDFQSSDIRLRGENNYIFKGENYHIFTSLGMFQAYHYLWSYERKKKLLQCVSRNKIDFFLEK